MVEWSKASRFVWVGDEWDWQPETRPDSLDIKGMLDAVAATMSNPVLTPVPLPPGTLSHENLARLTKLLEKGPPLREDHLHWELPGKNTPR